MIWLSRRNETETSKQQHHNPTAAIGTTHEKKNTLTTMTPHSHHASNHATRLRSIIDDLEQERYQQMRQSRRSTRGDYDEVGGIATAPHCYNHFERQEEGGQIHPSLDTWRNTPNHDDFRGTIIRITDKDNETVMSDLSDGSARPRRQESSETRRSRSLSRRESQASSQLNLTRSLLEQAVAMMPPLPLHESNEDEGQQQATTTNTTTTTTTRIDRFNQEIAIRQELMHMRPELFDLEISSNDKRKSRSNRRLVRGRMKGKSSVEVVPNTRHQSLTYIRRTRSCSSPSGSLGTALTLDSSFDHLERIICTNIPNSSYRQHSSPGRGRSEPYRSPTRVRLPISPRQRSPGYRSCFSSSEKTQNL